MSTSTLPRHRSLVTFALITATALMVTSCGAGESTGKEPSGRAGAVQNAALPTQDVVSGLEEVPAVSALLPEAVRDRGSLTLALSVGGNPPGSSYLKDGKTLAGQDVDFAHAVAEVLGIELQREVASFEAILPALGSGKYDIGTGNFGVTDERRKTIDFVTYINDGQGFATRADSALPKVTDLVQLCGRKVATGAGTTFEATLQDGKQRCEDAGKEPYEVQTYGDQSAIWSALQQGRADVVMSTINGLRYAVAQQKGFRFLNEYHRLDVGFAFKKGTPLAPAFRAAVNELIENGTYDRILAKWGTTGSALKSSEISPPEAKR
ncbi:transporter substrate-binding domain-containing protein [Streptomyces sp. NPDC005955]|uniref:ABC transporter substrate-binding protein n=1 Tax=Streptomyces sp. NPDC005955 TaxID=3364738 RepID=UPI0036ABECD9